MFVGATRYRGPRSIVMLSRAWFRMVRQMKRMHGYRWHKVYYEFPFTLGTIAFFSDRDALLNFARSRHHRDLMCWVTDHGTRNATGGYIRLYAAEPDGYTNGVWRAEGPIDGAHPDLHPARPRGGGAAGAPAGESAERVAVARRTCGRSASCRCGCTPATATCPCCRR